MSKDLKHFTCEDRLRELELFTLRKEKAWGVLFPVRVVKHEKR